MSAESKTILGKPLNRIDGRLKVTGKATYAAEYPLDNLVYGVLIQSTITKGTITKVDTAEAEKIKGVISVFTHLNAPRIKAKKKAPGDGEDEAGRNLLVLQDDKVRHNRQPIGLVVAETFEQAVHAAHLVEFTYSEEKSKTDISAKEKAALLDFAKKDYGTTRGDFAKGLSQAQAKVEQTYTTPMEVHSPMEPFAVIADWKGDNLTIYDSTQAIFATRKVVAQNLGIAQDKVRIISHYVGGGFGAKLSTWSHVVLAAACARQIGRPLKLVLARPQMFGTVGFRPVTTQEVTLAAKADGTLSAIRHVGVNPTSTFEDYSETIDSTTAKLYACPNLVAGHRHYEADIGTPTWMRGPGDAPGNFALESAMDELAYELKMDPIELRLRNFSERDPDSGLPWSTNALKQSYDLGKERIGWHKRNPKPGSMRDGSNLIGYGMASAYYPTYRMKASAQVRLNSDGSALVQTGSQDIGTGTYTVMTQIAADALTLPLEKVQIEIGDTNLPETPLSGGSMTAASVGSAVKLACDKALALVIEMAVKDKQSPLYGLDAKEIAHANGMLYSQKNEKHKESFAAIVERSGSKFIEAKVEAKPGKEDEQFAMAAFGAQFAEVQIDADLGGIRVSRFVSVIGAGKILNAKTARNQIAGGIMFGLGMALTEAAIFDANYGRLVNADLAEYHVPVNADHPNLDIVFVDENDTHVNPIGVKGIGEIGITGVPAAIANAVYHATGKRVRDLPITRDMLI